MTIVVLAEYYPTSALVDVRGGVEVLAFRISQALARRHDVTVLAVREPGTPADGRVGGVRVVRPGPVLRYRQAGGLVGRVRFVRAARRALLERQPDLILAECFLAYAVALGLPDRERRRTILHYADVWTGRWIVNTSVMTGLVGEAIERLVLRRSWLAFLAISRVTRDKLVEAGVDAARIHVRYPPFDTAECRTVVAERFGSPTIVTVARLVGYKRLGDLLQAFARVRQRRPDVRLVLIGSGPAEARLRRQCRALGLGDSVVWRGFVADHLDVLAAIKGATVVCLPSAVEGFGLAVWEALACGAPCVCGDLPVTREVSAGEGSLLCPVGDVDALAEALMAIVTDDTRRAELSTAALARAAALDRRRDADRTVELLERLSGGAPAAEAEPA